MNLGDYVAYRGKVDNFQSVVSMACLGACYDMVETMEYAPYNTGAKYCCDCRIYLFTPSNYCPSCRRRLRTKPKKRKNDKINRSALNLGDLGKGG